MKDNGFTSGLDKAKSAFEKIDGVANKVVGTIVKFGAAAGTALIGLGTAAVNLGSDFEKEMDNIAAITGMAAEEIKVMGDGIRDIAKDTGKNVLELASNAKMVAEAGGDMGLMMEQMARGTDLALATQTDMATTLDFLGSQMKTFGIEAEDTQSVVDSFAYVTTLANLELSQLGESYVNVGGSAANAGMSIDNVNSILTTFSNAGLKGGSAGTVLNTVIRNLSAPTEAAANTLEYLNIKLYDNEGASRDMFDIMSDLEVALSGLSDEQRNAAESAIFDTVALKGWNIIAAEGIDAIIELSDEISASSEAFDGLGQAAGMAAVQSDNLSGMLSKMKTSAQDMGIAFYEYIQEPLKEAVSVAADMISQLSEAFSEGGLDGLVSKAGDVIAQAVAYISEQAPKFVEVAVELINSLVDGLTSNSDTILTGASTAFEAIIDGLKEIFPKLVPFAIDVLTELASGFITYKELIYTTGVEILTQLIEGIAENLPELITQAQDAVMNIVNTIADNLPVILQSGIDIILSLADGIIKILPELIPLAVEAVMNIINTVSENLPAVLQAGIDILLALIDGIVEILPDLIPVAVDTVLTLVDALIDNIDLLIDASIAIMIALADGLVEALPVWVEKAPIIIEKLINAIAENAPKLLAASWKIISTLAQGMIDNLSEMGAATGRIIETVVDAAGNLLSDILMVGENIVKGIWEGISSKATWIKEQVTGFFSGIVDGVKGILGIHSPSKVFADEIGKNIALGVAEGISENSGEAEDAASEMSESTFGEIKGVTSSFAKTVRSETSPVGTEMIEGIISGIKDKAESLKGTVSSVIKDTISLVKDLLQISSPSKVFHEIGQAVDVGFSEGIEADADKPKQSMKQMMEDVIQTAKDVNQITSTSQVYADMGMMMVDGLIYGIQSKSSELINTVSSMLQQVIETANAALQINSPSKVFANIGKFTGQGFIEGINNISGSVTEAVDDVFGGIGKEYGVDLSSSYNSSIASTAIDSTSSAAGIGKGSGQNGNIENKFNIASLVVREEADIKKIARELYNMQARELRSRGYAGT